MRSSILFSLLPLAFAAPARRAEPAPLLRPRGVELIEGKFLVKMKDEVSVATMDEAMSVFEGEADHVWNVPGFKGFASALDDAAIATLQAHPDVSHSVERVSITSEYTMLTAFEG